MPNMTVEHLNSDEVQQYKQEAIVRETPLSVRFWDALEIILFGIGVLCMTVCALSLVGFLVIGTFWTIPLWLKCSLWGGFFCGITCFSIGCKMPKPQTNVRWQSYSLETFPHALPYTASQIIEHYRGTYEFAEFTIEALVKKNGEQEAFLVLKVNESLCYLKHWKINARVLA